MPIQLARMGESDVSCHVSQVWLPPDASQCDSAAPLSTRLSPDRKHNKVQTFAHTHKKPNTQTQLTINDSWYNIDVLKMVFYEPEGTVIYLFLNV